MLPFCNKPFYHFVIKSCCHFVIKSCYHFVINHVSAKVSLLNNSWWYYFQPYCATRLVLLLQMLLCCFTIYIAFRIILSRHSQGFYEELTVWFVSGEAAVHKTKCPLVPPKPKIYHRNFINAVPHPSQKLFVFDRFKMFQVECLYTVLSQKALYRPTIRGRQVWRPSHISKASGEVLFHCSAKFWHLHGSWFLVVHVLCLSGAGWS